MRRRGQQMRTSSPIVVLLIGLILILYILFLPPGQREALLSGSGGGSGGGFSGAPGGAPGGYVPGGGPGLVLLDKYVGTLTPQGQGTVEHPIPTTTVFTATNTEEVKFIDSMLVKKSAFGEQQGVLTFRADPGVAKNFLLTFNVEAAQGPLYISLNGHPIFERVITSRSPEPIKLPAEYLQAENTIVFRTGSPGWAFWRANTYDLRNILVSADVVNYAASQSEQHFTILPDEYTQLEQATLEFVPQCDPTQSGRLTITVNGALLYAGYIDCGVLTHQDIAKEQLVPGDNSLGFISSQGSYTLDRVRVVSKLKQEDYPVFYFNLPPDMFQAANVFNGQVSVTLRFTEGSTVKQGSIVVNGYQDSFNTPSYYYQATLDPGVLVPNANSIQILPQNGPLHVAELRVEMI